MLIVVGDVVLDIVIERQILSSPLVMVVDTTSG